MADYYGEYGPASKGLDERRQSTLDETSLSDPMTDKEEAQLFEDLFGG